MKSANLKVQLVRERKTNTSEGLTVALLMTQEESS